MMHLPPSPQLRLLLLSPLSLLRRPSPQRLASSSSVRERKIVGLGISQPERSSPPHPKCLSVFLPSPDCTATIVHPSLRQFRRL